MIGDCDVCNNIVFSRHVLDIRNKVADITKVPELAGGQFVGLLSKRENKGFVVHEHGERPTFKGETDVFYSEVHDE